jgi:hypothetical protein
MEKWQYGASNNKVCEKTLKLRVSPFVTDFSLVCPIIPWALYVGFPVNKDDLGRVFS